MIRSMARTDLADGLSAADHNADAVSVYETELAWRRRVGAPEVAILDVQSSLANTYRALGRLEDALRLRREVYSGCLRLDGEEHKNTLLEVNKYALCLVLLRRLEEARSLLRRTIPVAQRVLGEGQTLTLRMRCIYAEALYKDVDGTVEDLRARVGEAVTTLEEIERTAQRVLGVGHPLTVTIEKDLRTSRAGLRTLGPPPPGPSVERTFARGWLDGPS